MNKKLKFREIAVNELRAVYVTGFICAFFSIFISGALRHSFDVAISRVYRFGVITCISTAVAYTIQALRDYKTKEEDEDSERNIEVRGYIMSARISLLAVACVAAYPESSVVHIISIVLAILSAAISIRMRYVSYTTLALVAIRLFVLTIDNPIFLERLFNLDSELMCTETIMMTAIFLGWLMCRRLNFICITAREVIGVLESSADTDKKTGLLNCDKLKQDLQTIISKCISTEEAAERVAQASESSSVAVVMFDIDHFKSVNDSFGHLVGDFVLQRLTAIMSTTATIFEQEHPKSSISCYRYGGEEFTLIAEGVTYAEVDNLVADIRKEFAAQKYREIGNETVITVSAGIAYGSGKKSNELLQLADDNLYTAKNSGRDKSIGSIYDGVTKEEVSDGTESDEE